MNAISPLSQMHESYAAELTVRCGLEFGIQRHTIPQFEAVRKRWEQDLDFIILSIHQVDDQEFWTGDFQRWRPQQEYNDAYYEAVLDVVEAYQEYSVLGHLDLIKRYDPAGVYPFAKSRDVIAAILERAIADGWASRSTRPRSATAFMTFSHPRRFSSSIATWEAAS